MRYGAWLQLLLSVLLFIPLGLMSYFGAPNPVPLGLHSSIGVAFIVLAATFSLYFIPRRPALLVLSIFLAVCMLLIIANWWHFQFFRAYFNFEFLAFARDSGEALHSVGEFAYKPAAIVLGILYLGTCLVFYYWRHFSCNRRLIVGQILVLVCSGVFLLTSVNSRLELLRKANAFTLSPYYLHPLHAFFYSLRESIEGDSESWQRFKQKNQIREKGYFLADEVTPKKYNIIVITMESFRASFLGAYNPSSHLTPNFDRIVDEGVLFKNFYANSNYTIKGENAIICGIFDHNAKISIAEYPAKKNLNCLPSIFSHTGYSSYYFHGNHGKFYNRSTYLPEVGFENTYFHADRYPNKDDGRFYIGWGVSDLDLFSLVLSSLENSGRKPFYAHVMSISNHYPFKYDWPIDVPNDLSAVSGSNDAVIYAAYENAIYYSDYALGQFWGKFKSSKLYRNTIVIITADHGVWNFDESRLLDDSLRNEELFRMPLFVYHPDINQGYTVDQVASQVDIPVTLLELTGVDFLKSDFIGKNLFDQVVDPWAVMMKGGEASVRLADELCLPKTLSCAGAYQSCWTDMEASEFVDNLGQGHCFSYQGDPLADGFFKVSESNPGVLLDSVGLISFENRRIFEKEFAADFQVPSHSSIKEIRERLEESPDEG